MTVGAVRRTLAGDFRRVGLDSPELDARLLVGHALGLDQSALALAEHRILDAREAAAIAALTTRRLAREPVARILGHKEFWGLPLRVNAATLVPRPGTETLVEAALQAIDTGGPRNRALTVADLGTGSGALLLALLSELPRASGVGTDVSHEALAIAKENAKRTGLSSRARFVACEFGAALASHFDLVVCNPPYIATSDMADLPPEVRYDPYRALDGGTDGLACHRAVATEAPRLLNPTGHLVVELGIGQEPAVAALLRASGLAPAPARTDLGGIPRALVAAVATMAP